MNTIQDLREDEQGWRNAVVADFKNHREQIILLRGLAIGLILLQIFCLACFTIKVLSWPL